MTDGRTDIDARTRPERFPAMAHRARVWLGVDRLDPRLLIALLAIDAFFVAMHLVQRHVAGPGSPFANELWGLSKDHGYQELYGYLCELGMAVLLLLTWRRTSTKGYLWWAAVFALIGVDDAITIHETVGRHLLLNFPDLSAAGLTGQEIGELATWTVLGLASLALLVHGWRTAGARPRADFRMLAAVLAGLVVCAVVIDAATVAVWEKLVLVEDGGEMVVVSLGLAVAWAIHSQADLELEELPGPRRTVPAPT